MYYRSLSSELKEKFGCKVYKLSLDGGFSCPNRDGTLGTGGCIFCLGGSGDFAERSCESVSGQIERAKARVKNKSSGGKYIAYFQSYTNTYGPLKQLEELFSEAISNPEIVALSIGTRPDCLPDETVALLSRLNKVKPVWVELGLQTIHERTAEYIGRGYPLSVYDNAVLRLKAEGIYVVTHIIIGLPGETSEMIYKTIEHINRVGTNGIKLQLLHVLKGTGLEHDWRSEKFKTLSMNEYISILEGCVRRLSPDITIHRLTGDGNKKNLLSPLWSADKKNVLNSINTAFRQDNVVQGELYEI